MGFGGVLIVLCLIGAILGLIRKIRKDSKRRDAVTAVMRPLLEKTFGQYEYDPDRHFFGTDSQGLVEGDPGGRDLVSVRYKETDVRFCVMHFTSEEEKEDGSHYTMDRFWGPWIIVGRENFINNPVYVGSKKSVFKKERVLTDDEAFDSFLAARGEPAETLKLLSPSVRVKIADLMHRHPYVSLLFESDRIKVSYAVGEYFTPQFGRKTEELYEQQLKDLLDIIDTLVDL